MAVLGAAVLILGLRGDTTGVIVDRGHRARVAAVVVDVLRVTRGIPAVGGRAAAALAGGACGVRTVGVVGTGVAGIVRAGTGGARVVARRAVVRGRVGRGVV